MNWRDLLFRIGLYRGVKMTAPPDLIRCSLYRDTQFTLVFETALHEEHPLADWLLDECEGPWAVRMRRPRRNRQTYLAFARVADAVTFRLLSA
jgi:hypothetical protein